MIIPQGARALNNVVCQHVGSHECLCVCMCIQNPYMTVFWFDFMLRMHSLSWITTPRVCVCVYVSVRVWHNLESEPSPLPTERSRTE